MRKIILLGLAFTCSTVAASTSEATSDKPLSAQFGNVASGYNKTIHYPSYSKPLSANDTGLLNPNTHHTTHLPVVYHSRWQWLIYGYKEAAIQLNKHHFSYPDQVELNIDANTKVESIDVELINQETREVIAQITNQGSEATIPTEAHWPDEILVKARIQFDIGEDAITTSMAFGLPVAQINRIELPTAKGADLYIPVNIEALQAGLYRVQANLFTQNGDPVALLTSSKRLSEGNSSLLELKVHKSVLLGTKGPYQLQNVQIERMTDTPFEKQRRGRSTQETFPIADFDLNELTDDAYTPTQEELDRLKFLNSLSK
ncbi:hypothetical protein [uncultured Photobacterium sp.]|uniref:hypothetical protein n=1 Tax=uncultured Photobacterium sp. TaxID=173973 RepID=UPI0026150A6D|nr:hypothetical protein [uncultured Photobacterium sp.]